MPQIRTSDNSKIYSDNDRCNKCSTFQIESWIDELCGNEYNPPYEMRRGVAYGQCCHCDPTWTCEEKHVCTPKGPKVNPKNLDSKKF